MDFENIKKIIINIIWSSLVSIHYLYYYDYNKLITRITPKQIITKPNQEQIKQASFLNRLYSLNNKSIF